MLYEVRNMAGEVVGEVPSFSERPESVDRMPRGVVFPPDAGDLIEFAAAAEALALAAERRSPTEQLSAAIARFRHAQEALRHPARDIRPGADAFRPINRPARQVVSTPQSEVR